MNTLERKFNNLTLKAYFGAATLKERAKSAFKKENGDTNFLSIIIILAIVLVAAMVFLALKDKIVGAANGAYENFASKFNGQSSSVAGGDNLTTGGTGGVVCRF